MAGAVRTRTPAGALARIARKEGRIDSLSSWRYWWAYNRDPYLRLRERFAEDRQFTGSSNWLLGTLDRNRGIDLSRPGRRFLEEHVAPRLAPFVADPDPRVRASILVSLGRMALASEVPRLVRALEDPALEVKEGAVLGLGLCRLPAAGSVLGEVLAGGAAGRRLARLGEVPPRLRGFAAIGLGFIGGEEAGKALLRTVGEGVARRDVAACALVGLGMMEYAPAAPRLRRILEDPRGDDLLRAYAAVALGRLDDTAAVPSLRAALRRGAWQTRRSAVLALGLLAGPDDQRTIQALRSTVRKGSDPQARYWACLSLGRIGGGLARAALLETLRSGLPELRCHAALGLGILASGDQDPSVRSVLAARLRRERDPLVRSAHAVALGILGDRVAIPVLRGLLEEGTNPLPRYYATVALGMLHDRGSLDRFRAWVRDESVHPDLRHASALAIGLMGDRSVLRTLERAMLETTSPVVRDGSTVALGFLGDSSSIAPLETMLADEGVPREARVRAAIAIGLVAEDTPLPLFHRVVNEINYRNPVAAIATLLHQF